MFKRVPGPVPRPGIREQGLAPRFSPLIGTGVTYTGEHLQDAKGDAFYAINYCHGSPLLLVAPTPPPRGISLCVVDRKGVSPPLHLAFPSRHPIPRSKCVLASFPLISSLIFLSRQIESELTSHSSVQCVGFFFFFIENASLYSLLPSHY